jgi:hypothetical protein
MSYFLFYKTKEENIKTAEEIDDLIKRTEDMYYREVEVIGILDNLMETLTS